MESKFYGKKIEIANTSNDQDLGAKTNQQNLEIYQQVNNYSSTDLNNIKHEAPNIIQNQKNNYYFGKHIPLLFCGSEQPLITIGPDFMCFIFGFSFFLGAGLYVSLSGQIVNKICLIATILQSVLYLLTALKNPGICCKPQNDSENQLRGIANFCNICQVTLNKYRQHCKECQICIEGMDHHCPWTGKCVGRGNVCLFYSFIVSTFAYFGALLTQG